MTYFGENGNYLNFFKTNASSSNITPQVYANFTAKKLGNLNASSVRLSEEQKSRLTLPIKTWESLCSLLSQNQLDYVGW